MHIAPPTFIFDFTHNKEIYIPKGNYSLQLTVTLIPCGDIATTKLSTNNKEIYIPKGNYSLQLTFTLIPCGDIATAKLSTNNTDIPPYP